MSAPTSPGIRPDRLLPTLAAVAAVLALALATVVATAANARAHTGEVTDPSTARRV